MIKIIMSGDTHCPHDIHKLNSKNFPEGNSLTKDDLVIICGDAGFVFDGDKEDEWWIKWISNKPWTTIFCDGNHENFDLLNQYPIVDFFGAKAHKITDSLFHILRGEIMDYYGLTIFFFGGGVSHDVERRIEGLSWWKEELPTQEEIDRAYNNLKKYDNHVDYIVTHDASVRFYEYFHYQLPNMLNYDQKQQNIVWFFYDLEKQVTYKKWFHGHFHRDIEILDHHFLYHDLIEINDD